MTGQNLAKNFLSELSREGEGGGEDEQNSHSLTAAH